MTRDNAIIQGTVVGWMSLSGFGALAWVSKKGLKAHVDSFLYEQQQKKLNPGTYYPIVKAKQEQKIWWLGWIGSGVLGSILAWVGVTVNQSLFFPENLVAAWASALPVAWAGSGAVFWSVQSWILKQQIDADVWNARLAAQVYFTRAWGIFAGLGLLLWCVGVSVTSWPLASTLWALQGGAFGLALLLGSHKLNPKRLEWEKNRLLTAESNIAAATNNPITTLVGRDPHPATKPPTRILETKEALPLQGLGLVPRQTQASQFITGDETFDAEVSVLIDPKRRSYVITRLLIMLGQEVRDKIREGIKQGVI